MKKYKSIVITLLTLGIYVGCTNDFQVINQDPNVAVPPSEYLLTYAMKEMGTYKGAEWYHENHQTMTWAQYLVQGESNAGGVDNLLDGSRYGTFYGAILNHLTEFRRQVSLMPEEEQEIRKKMVAVSDILQAYFALKITDQYGRIPYTEASLGRSEGLTNPNYDTQEQILNTLLTELDNAISVLNENLDVEFDFAGLDFYYGADWDKWIKCANAVKLRIATRFESQDESKTRSIIASVVSGDGSFTSEDDQFIFDISQIDEWRGTSGADFEWKGTMWGPKPTIEYMKETLDPRLRIFYQVNGYHEATLDIYEASNTPLPAAVDTENDTKVLYTTAEGEEILGYRFIGVPPYRQDPTIGQMDYNYADNSLVAGINANMISKYHQRLLQNVDANYGGPRLDGKYVDVFISYAEVCFMMSEFILKGYTTGNAEEWYENGIKASINTYNMLGEVQNLSLIVGNKTYNYLPVSNSETESYINESKVVFNGTNDLEKVYIQAFLNFYRLPEEGWALSKRTGYPRFGSSILARTPVDDNELKFPRRIPTPEPGDLNRENWLRANSEQGFINPQDISPAALNEQRVWWDKNNPTIGSGGN